jgi:GT2 family glycosyltransferase
MKLMAIILNWRTPDMTLQALGALVPELRSIPTARGVIVDNDSQDGSFEKLTEAVTACGLADLVDVVQSGKNGGFGFGNNVGIRLGLQRGAEYCYVLNSDAFPDPGSVKRLVDYLDAHPTVGIAGSYIYGVDGVPHETAFRFPSLANEIDRGLKLGIVSRLLKDKIVPMPIPTTDTPVDWLAGASIMFRRQMLEQVGMFDETFFLYFEETDLCLRAHRAGWPTHYVRGSTVRHIGGATTGMKNKTQRMPTYIFESRRHYLLKNHGRRYLWACDAAYVLASATFQIRRRHQGKDDPDRPKELIDFLRFELTSRQP